MGSAVESPLLSLEVGRGSQPSIVCLAGNHLESQARNYDSWFVKQQDRHRRGLLDSSTSVQAIATSSRTHKVNALRLPAGIQQVAAPQINMSFRKCPKFMEQYQHGHKTRVIANTPCVSSPAIRLAILVAEESQSLNLC